MSLQSVVSNQLKQSGRRLSYLGKIASYLLEDVLIRIDKHAIEPTHETNIALLSAAAVVEGAVIAETADSQTYFNSIRKRVESKIRDVVGRSPDIISDIADAIAKPIKDIIDTALKPITDTLKGIITFITDSLKDFGLKIGEMFAGVIKTVQTWIQAGFDWISEGVTFIQTTIAGLLEGVVNAFDTFTLMLQKAFAGLVSGFEKILRITPDALFNLQKDLQKLFLQEKADIVKTTVARD